MRNQETAPPSVLDIEASGFGAGSYPIEIGFALPDHSTHCRLVKPCPHWTHWSKQAESMHGVSQTQLQEKGVDVKILAEWLNTTLADKTVYSDAWSHDMSWLGKLFDAADITPTFKIDSIVTLLSEQQLDQWHTKKELVMAALNVQRHRASSDALIIQRTLMALLDIPLPT